MPNLSALAPITTAATALSNLILVSPQSTIGYQPQNVPNADGSESLLQQPPALLFHYEGEQTAVIESDITDHFVEDNTAIQDQIALKPEIITTHGFIGDLNDIAPSFLKPLKFAADKLTTIGAYAPQVSTTALLAYSEAFFLYQVAANAVNSAVSAWNTITGQGGLSVIGSGGITAQADQTPQQKMFQQMYGYWRARTLFTVQTPWAVFQNMAIKSLRAIQDADTNTITDFEVSFKMIRTVASITTGGIANTFQGQASSQSAVLQDLGTSSPVPGVGLDGGLAQMGVA